MDWFDFSLKLPITDPTWIFLLVLLIILFAPILLNKLRIPHIIGMILAGLVIGEHGFNILVRDSSFELFGKVGLYYIMFLAGLEMNMGDFKQNRGKALVLGLLAFIVPIGIGLVTNIALLKYGVLTSVLLASMYASHTLVAYPIVIRYGVSRHRSVSIAVGGTAVTDTLTLLVLAVVGGMFKGESDGFFWVWLVIKVIFLGILIVYLFPRIGRWFFRRYDAVHIRACHGFSRSRIDGVCGDGRYPGCFPCRFGFEPADSACLSADEPSGVCGQRLVYSLFPDRRGYAD